MLLSLNKKAHVSSSMRLCLTITTLASIFISSSLAIPIQSHQTEQQALFHITAFDSNQDTAIDASTATAIVQKVPSASYIENYNRITDLDDFYSTIVNQVVDSTINEIIETAPETYLTIHELQLVGREYCRSSLRAFMQLLANQLNRQMKNSLLVSVQPLVDHYYVEKQNDILGLNTIISQQLGLIVNPSQLSNQIVQQLYPPSQEEQKFSLIWKFWFDKKWTQTIHHEKKELKALEAWLRSWLMDIEYILKDEFDSRVGSVGL